MAIARANGSILKANGKVLVRRSTPIIEQEWTKTNVPAGVQTLHDFGDGAGPVPAIPFDNASVTNDVIQMKVISHFGTDNASVTNDVIDIQEVV